MGKGTWRAAALAAACALSGCAAPRIPARAPSRVRCCAPLHPSVPLVDDPDVYAIYRLLLRTIRKYRSTTRYALSLSPASGHGRLRPSSYAQVFPTIAPETVASYERKERDTAIEDRFALAAPVEQVEGGCDGRNRSLYESGHSCEEQLVRLSQIGFNPRHTEALVAKLEAGGGGCGCDYLFWLAKRADGSWIIVGYQMLRCT